MAQYLLVSILVHNPPTGSTLASNDVIDVYWNDGTSAIVVNKNGSAMSPGPGDQVGELNTNYYVSGITSYEGEYAIAGYSFCDSTTLNWFKMVTMFPSYPFMSKQLTANSPVCATGGGAVCDIHFNGPPTITHAADRITGGSITVSATSSNGTVKYSLKNSDYADMSNTTGVFTGIRPGTWTVYAKDENDCTIWISFKILFKPTEAEHYRFSWSTAPIGQGTSYSARLRIYEREYVGDLVEIDRGDESPFRLMKPKSGGSINDKFFPIHPTSATLVLYSQRDYQFLPLFTQDNKKYRGVYEVDTGSGFTEIWQGFELPSVYREDFISVPYTVELQFADNVKTLEQEPFTDAEGHLLFGQMSLIKLIAFIMKKTGLSLSIRSGINIFETSHNTAATDDPLAQTYIDVACYREDDEPFKCWQVLEAVLRPFGARIFQCDNQWQIEEIDRAVASYTYRVFDSDGNYVSNSTFDPIVDIKSSGEIDRIAMVDEDQSMEVIPAYGNIDIISKLNYIGSIVSGGFDRADLLSPESETFSQAQGVFTSEEGFRDWTLRQPAGIGGVSFGRVVVGNRGDNTNSGLRNEKDITRSVGAFFYGASGWQGNLRNAYIESAAKPYQYGPNDDITLRFEYSTPAKPEYEFMVLRFMIKVGSNYLQQDLTWDTTEYIYRAYPAVTNSLQGFELSVPVPETTVVVDSTIQVRIYFYAPEFYDYGMASTTGVVTDGIDGVAGLKDLDTVDIDYDYRVDIRQEHTEGAATVSFRTFRELVISSASEDLPLGVIQAGDFHATTNPKCWRMIKMVMEHATMNTRTRGLDRKFYVDDITLDALINGQPPPLEDNISLQISKYINENLEVELYNFDLPEITNGKNMYNNYFRLSDGTPTALWTRSGISELLTLQQILLKVLGANHSAPTFRLTGTFVNEFARIGINNYLRLTKSGSALTAINTEFTTDLSGWSQSSLPLTGTWAWTADNSGSAEVTMSGGTDSKKIYQEITHLGGYVLFTVNIKGTPALSTNTSEDVLWVLFYNGSSIIHTEKMQTFVGITSESTYDFTYKAFAPGGVTRIGFYMQRLAGNGDVTYQVSKFSPERTDIEEVYQIADYSANERMNEYQLELMQISKTFVSLGSIDSGGNNQGGSTTGRAHSSGHSSGFN